MRRSAFAVAVATVLFVAAPSRASLTPSEVEQVRRGVQAATDLPRVRALVARPDLSSEEAAAAMIAPLTTTPVDAAHVSFLNDMVFGDSSAASRPVLVVAAVRGALARADAVIGQHGLDLDRAPAVLAELSRVYGWVERVAAASESVNVANVTDSALAQCARVLAEHIARNAAVLSPQVAVGSQVARARAQAAIALLDFMPDAPTRRIDAADRLGLTGSRRAFLVERGVLVLDAGGTDARVASLRLLFDRVPALREGLEAIVLGGDPAALSARNGGVLVTPEDPGGNAGTMLLWGSDVRSPPGDGWTTAVVRGLATAAVSRAAARSDALRAQVERDGGVTGVAAMGAMLLLNGPLAVEVAAARLLAGAKESATCLADAVGALALLASPPASTAPPTAHDAAGANVLVGPAKTSGPPAQLTHVTIGPTGAATAFRLEGRTWLFDRDATGALTGLRRDGVPVSRAMLVAARP